ncbi:A/G-specific adenine glycosylase [Cytophagaceae bacterium ABcell3]|nr:A/G-specific adenine glycosylase [Cytophagaceae bacterium ABcell3]
MFSENIINWYKSNKRDLPWRGTRDPYFIWLSEILLQQTRVNQGLPYYYKFTERFPDVLALANAEEQEVLRLWQGLGYYNRARNMHATSRYIANKLDGKFPDTYKGLLKLRGVGNYTAAAIASFAFKEPVAVLDGNVIRVISRVFGIDGDIRKGSVVKELQSIANDLLPKLEHDVYNQGIMEFGALHCMPSAPKCANCPLRQMCYAYKHKIQDKLPYKSKAARKKERYFDYYVLESPKGIFMQKRNNKDIWAGLYDFPCSEGAVVTDRAKSEIFSYLGIDKNAVLLCQKSEVFKHVLTHQNLYASFWHIKLGKCDVLMDNSIDGQFFSFDNIRELPKPVLINNYLNTYIF